MVTPEMIQAFLSVVECGNITLAANNLFTTQSNLSKQIKMLEGELGVELLIRKKGHSTVSLTPYGKNFLQLSRNWETLMKEIYDVKNSRHITEVSIGALDRINSFTLTDFYNHILDHHTDIRIDTHTRHSRELYRMMEANQLDLALVSSLMPASNIKVTPLYKELMFVICSKETELGKIVKPSDLDPDKEVFSRWSDEFEIWHDQYWPGKQYRIHVGTTSMTPDYLTEKGRWSIMPVSTLRALLKSRQFTHHTLSEEPPKRTIYLLEQKQPRESREEGIRLIRNQLIQYLSKDPYLEINPKIK